MNELQLSDDLPIIESELKAFKEMNGYSIYEIGRRLKHVKENDLVHGQWTEWLEKVDVHPREAQRFIKIVSDPQLKTTTWSHLGSRALYEITGVPYENRLANLKQNKPKSPVEPIGKKVKTPVKENAELAKIAGILLLIVPHVILALSVPH